METKALRIPYSYNPIIAPMDGHGSPRFDATKGNGDVAFMMQPSCMLACYVECNYTKTNPNHNYGVHA